jgi:16S rRNA (uracil1498-N3)-methyltransferase
MKSIEGKILTSPRLYVTSAVIPKEDRLIQNDQAHYLRNVVRVKAGDNIRLFDGQNGEHSYQVDEISKKEIRLSYQDQIEKQPTIYRRLHLLFVPVRKNRQDWLIEKAVELGATDLHPVLSVYGQVRALKKERVQAQIIEAAEQCERLDIPRLHDMRPLPDYLAHQPDFAHYACLERLDSRTMPDPAHLNQECAVLIGPEGGFSPEETKMLADKMRPLSLGERILRSETAAIKALILLQHSA